jgi:hypothetical protein
LPSQQVSAYSRRPPVGSGLEHALLRPNAVWHVVLVRFAIAEEARSRLGNALPCLLFLRRIGCAPDGAGSGLGFCVLHEPDAGHHHCEQDDPGDEEPHGHLLSAPQRSVERADCKDRGHPEAGEQGLRAGVREPQDHRETKGEEGGERD